MDSFPIGLAVADLNGDGLADISAASGIGRSVTVFLNRGGGSFAPPTEYLFNFSLLGHRLADLDLDGALDLLAYQGNIAVVIAGFQPTPIDRRFIRGDADRDGRVEINDAILILDRLFLGGAAIACANAADADDDGEFNLTDSIAILFRLFLGGAPLPPPRPAACGEY